MLQKSRERAPRPPTHQGLILLESREVTSELGAAASQPSGGISCFSTPKTGEQPCRHLLCAVQKQSNKQLADLQWLHDLVQHQAQKNLGLGGNVMGSVDLRHHLQQNRNQEGLKTVSSAGGRMRIRSWDMIRSALRLSHLKL